MISKFIRKNIDTVILNKNFARKRAIYKIYRIMGYDSSAQQEYMTGLELGIKYTKASIWKLEDKHNNFLSLGEETTEEITDLARYMIAATMAIDTTQAKKGFNDGMYLVIEAYKYLVSYEVYYQIGLLSEASRNKLIQPTKKSEAVHI